MRAYERLPCGQSKGENGSNPKDAKMASIQK
jgi:hypothetical protein